MRSKFLFNHGWLFAPEMLDDGANDNQFEPVILPHSNIILPHHHFDDMEYQFISTYRKRFSLPEPLNGRRLFVDFDGAMIAATVTINGHTFDEYRGGYTPFSYDLTDYIREDGENLLTIHLDSTERKDIPPFGGYVDYLAFGGIYRDVYLRYVEPSHITNVFVRPQAVMTNSPSVEVDIHLSHQSSDAIQAILAVKLADCQGEGILSTTQPVSLASGTQVATVKLENLSRIERWSLDNPILYHAEVALLVNDRETDRVNVRFGFREAIFKKDGFYLNGERIKLMGLNRHQTFPYFGAAAPERLQRRDADILKHELSLNIVRTSHYPQSPHFLDRCDEIGLLVLEEIPGWQHIGDENWQNLTVRNVRAMIERDWNHPSIILWGVRINESLDHHDLYTKTNALARELDPTRQTGGIRNSAAGDDFLEDVFTFNDFSNSVRKPRFTPYLITEFNGHMFPTKTWDGEERLMEHALRHARIQDKQMGTKNVSGAIGWCAFDYNTHRDFGSGDRICYHGVMDIFRLPKYAAYVYASQVAPEKRIVLQAATIWTMGDRSAGGNNPLIIFSNCDEIEVFVGDTLYGRFKPDRKAFPNLPYPPYSIELKTTWGKAFHNLRLVGYVNGENVAQQEFPTNPMPHQLRLWADDNELRANGMDMTRIAFQIVDEFGNRLPYSNSVVTFEIDGPATLIGENPFPLIGGQAALYLRARQETGTVTIRASATRLDPAEVEVGLIAPEDKGLSYV